MLFFKAWISSASFNVEQNSEAATEGGTMTARHLMLIWALSIAVSVQEAYSLPSPGFRKFFLSFNDFRMR